MTDDLRECPIDGCTERHARTKLMCRDHWYMVPKELRDAVWKAYRGAGVFSEEYAEARDAAIAAAETG
jgi:hypothetical protein